MIQSLAAAGQLVSSKLLDPDYVEEVSQAASQKNDSLRVWDGVTLANGHAGLAVLFATLSNTPKWEGDDYLKASTAHMGAAIQSTQGQPLTGNDLFSGSAGLAFALDLCSKVEPRFERARHAAVIAALEHGATEYLDQRIDGVGPEDYDVVSGPAGYLGWLLTLPSDIAGPDVELVSTSLSGLFQKGPVDTAKPTWRILPELTLQEERLAMAPQGYTDMGIAHGVPGPLAALSLIPSPSRKVSEAVCHLVDWILSATTEDEFGSNWPTVIPVGVDPQIQTLDSHSRTAWCYGSPGVLMALVLAQRSQPHLKLGSHIEQGIEALASRVANSEGFKTPTLCHGSSGVALILRRLQLEHGFAGLEEALSRTCESLLEHIDETAPFGVREVEPDGEFVDNPTLLNGAAGVALAIHSILADERQSWTRMMMIG